MNDVKGGGGNTNNFDSQKCNAGNAENNYYQPVIDNSTHIFLKT